MLNYSFNKNTVKKHRFFCYDCTESPTKYMCVGEHVMLFCVSVGKYINIDVYIYDMLRNASFCGWVCLREKEKR